MIKRTCLTTVTALALMAGGAACTSAQTETTGDGGTKKSGQKVEQKQDPAQGQEAPAQGGAPAPEGAPPSNDLTIKTCGLGDPWGLGEQIPMVDVTVTNSSSKVSDYDYEIEVTDSSGNRIETLWGYAENVSPGQTIDTGSGDGEEDPLSSLSRSISGPITCQVLYVDRWAV